jgi:hypothetical protein
VAPSAGDRFAPAPAAPTPFRAALGQSKGGGVSLLRSGVPSSSSSESCQRMRARGRVLLERADTQNAGLIRPAFVRAGSTRPLAHTR